MTRGFEKNARKRVKVLLDTDMVELYDDGIAMAMLAAASNVELLGVCVVTGNTWVDEGAAFAIRQLEALGLGNSIPVVTGEAYPLRSGRLSSMKKERELFGCGRDDFQGAGAYERPASWKSVYKNIYGMEPNVAPLSCAACDFVAETVRKYPGEVTIVSIGPLTNIARALQKAPETASYVKQIIYMGGAFAQEGNVTPSAEFNIWFDPEAARAVFRAPFKNQLIVPLNACEKIVLTAKRYMESVGAVKNPILREMTRRDPRKKRFDANPDYVSYVWDAIAAAIAIDGSVVTEEVTLPVDVNDTYSLSYGETLAFRGAPPSGARLMRIALSVDEEKLWNMIIDTCRAV